MIRMTPTLNNSFSLEAVTRLRAEGFAHVGHHNAMVLSLATGIEALDAALRLTIAERSVDESQALVDEFIEPLIQQIKAAMSLGSLRNKRELAHDLLAWSYRLQYLATEITSKTGGAQ